VRADPGQIGQILMNLVINARDAMPKGGQLTIETANVELDARYIRNHPYATPGSYVMLAVTDTGTGMTPEVKARIFEPFFTTKPAGTGTGLGLATVFGIVKQNGGLVDCYSELGRGTSLKVYLPRCLDGAVGAQTPVAPAITHSGHESILVVEDEECVRDLVREVLEDQGYTVIEARDPVRALELFEIHRECLDAVVTDMVMPEMDGRALVAELRRRRADLPSLFLSGYPERGAAQTLELEAGIEFLQKPFTPDALARKLRHVLDARGRDARVAHG
jgi:CheY-like chemotaxis protein